MPYLMGISTKLVSMVTEKFLKKLKMSRNQQRVMGILRTESNRKRNLPTLTLTSSLQALVSFSCSYLLKIAQ